jgi:hypothetical protein
MPHSSPTTEHEILVVGVCHCVMLFLSSLPRLSLPLLALFLFVVELQHAARGQVINLVSRQQVTNIWFEVGFASVSNVDWVSISTFQSFSKPLVFISHPDLSSTANFPVVPRVRNILKLNGGAVSFQTKLYLPNDSFCSKQWYIPQYIQPAKQASWAVFESGAYNISGNALYLSQGPINRLSSSGQ